MLEDKQVISGTMYSYPHEGDDKMGVLEHITRPIRNVVWVKFDNGDQIPLEEFKKIGTPVDESQDHISNVKNSGDENNQLNDIQKGADSLVNNIEYDSDGIPIMKTATGEDLSDVVYNPAKEKPPGALAAVQNANDPVIALLNKAKTSDVTLQIDLPLKLIEKTLFDVIMTSFEEGSKETVFKFIMASIPQEELKASIIGVLEKYYGKNEDKN